MFPFASVCGRIRSLLPVLTCKKTPRFQQRGAFLVGCLPAESEQPVDEANYYIARKDVLLKDLDDNFPYFEKVLTGEYDAAEIEVIDEDLGRSAAGGVQRAGFERMVAEVCLGKVGAVCAREVSRFARNSRDWQQLIEMCRVVDTLLVDLDTIYAP